MGLLRAGPGGTASPVGLGEQEHLGEHQEQGYRAGKWWGWAHSICEAGNNPMLVTPVPVAEEHQALGGCCLGAGSSLHPAGL